MIRDARDVAHSTNSALAVQHYETALVQFQSYRGDALATLDAAIAADPSFVSAHLFKAFVLYTLTERKFVPDAVAALDAARAHAAIMTPRERLLLAAGDQLVGYEWDAACRTFDAVLADHPRDAVALQTAHLMDFARGDALNLRNRIARVLPHWSAQVPGHSYVLGMLAFGLEECNQYPEAERTARRALDIEPKDGWSVHAATHVMEMQGRIDEGIDWLQSREQDWAPDNGFAFHNWWHLALFHLDRGDIDRVLDLYDTAVHPEPAVFALALVDATALLWRLTLEGVDVGDRWESVAANWEQRLDVERGHYAFNDLHAMLAFAAAGRAAAAGRLQLDLQTTALEGRASAGMMAREIGLPLALGIRAYARQDFDAAVDLIQSTRDRAHRFGGSHAQRDLLSLTLIDAARRAGHPRLARHVLAERAVLKPTAWSDRLARRIDAGDAGSDQPAAA
ncbi:MAG: tetratricopeptide repeat protein [Betaproteobacteria bacterium]